MRMKQFFLFVMLCTVLLQPAHAQSMLDSLQQVDEVVVVGRLRHQETLPAQHLKGKQLEHLDNHSIADALRYFAGVQLKDYGGVGGIKSIDVRSMGSGHMGIYYDGIELGNAQNTQTDLGQFSLDNVEEITLYNGQKSSIFQTASDFGHAGSVYIRTRRPQFTTPQQRQRTTLKAAYGSSDNMQMAALWERQLTQTTSTSLNAAVQTASGRYHFRYRRALPDGTTAYDTTAVRQNGDIQSSRLEWNIYGGDNRQGLWSGKAYVYWSDRGIPGAIVNNVWRRGERQHDLNSFVQGSWQKDMCRRFSSRLMAKYAYYRTRYMNHDITQLPTDNHYYQQELFLSTSNVLEIVPHWSASISYDLRWNKLNADSYRFAYPTRWSNLVAMATALDLYHLKVQASALSSFIHDHTRDGHPSASYRRLTPALFINLLPFADQRLTIHAYAKQSFRMPTFNDLYYTDMGNAMLRPERATQYDIGLRSRNQWNIHGWKWTLELGGDTYYNTTRDKIIAYPKGQQFRWTMLNLGKVRTIGAEATAAATCQPNADMLISMQVQYTYQRASDKTNPATPYYNHQIPYIPRHSGSLTAAISYKHWTANYSFIYTGERYNEQENIIYNHMEPWYTSDMSLQYDFTLMRCQWKATLEVNNLLSQDYDVILNYPMPKRNYMMKVSVTI